MTWRKIMCQGYHGACRARYRCCLPALAGFASPQSMGPGKIRVSIRPHFAGASKLLLMEFALLPRRLSPPSSGPKFVEHACIGLHQPDKILGLKYAKRTDVCSGFSEPLQFV